MAVQQDELPRPLLGRAGRRSEVMGMNGVDLLRIEGERIAEVWLFSAGQQGEDEFWGNA